VSVAVETQGADAARLWVEKSGGAHPTVVDEHNLLGRLLDFKRVPNGVFLDEQGTIRYAKYGGFSVDQPEDVETIQRLIDGEIAQQAATETEAPYALSSIESQLIETRLRLGSELLARGESEGALAEWRKALEMDPENFVIRKQIWAVRYPEKFYPTIDFDWQGEQLRRDREEEIARGVCGPDGCPLPRKSS
jgi:tetratricopeptide (TPR) repeat protein